MKEVIALIIFLGITGIALRWLVTKKIDNKAALIEEFLEAQLRGKNRSYILSFPDLIGESRKQ